MFSRRHALWSSCSPHACELGGNTPSLPGSCLLCRHWCVRFAPASELGKPWMIECQLWEAVGGVALVHVMKLKGKRRCSCFEVCMCRGATSVFHCNPQLWVLEACATPACMYVLRRYAGEGGDVADCKERPYLGIILVVLEVPFFCLTALCNTRHCNPRSILFVRTYKTQHFTAISSFVTQSLPLLDPRAKPTKSAMGVKVPNLL